MGFEWLVLSQYPLLKAVVQHVCFEAVHLLFLLTVCLLGYNILAVQHVELLLQLLVVVTILVLA